LVKPFFFLPIFYNWRCPFPFLPRVRGSGLTLSLSPPQASLLMTDLSLPVLFSGFLSQVLKLFPRSWVCCWPHSPVNPHHLCRLFYVTLFPSIFTRVSPFLDTNLSRSILDFHGRLLNTQYPFLPLLVGGPVLLFFPLMSCGIGTLLFASLEWV